MAGMTDVKQVTQREISAGFLAHWVVVCLQIVLENSSREDKHECPFGRSSIELTKMLCEILKVGELRKSPHSEQKKN